MEHPGQLLPRPGGLIHPVQLDLQHLRHRSRRGLCDGGRGNGVNISGWIQYWGSMQHFLKAAGNFFELIFTKGQLRPYT